MKKYLFFTFLCLSIIACNSNTGGPSDEPKKSGLAHPLKAVEVGDKFAYVDQNGKEALKANYGMAEDFNEFFIAMVTDDESWACIDTNGTVLLRPFIFDNGPDSYSEGLARFVEKGKIGFFDNKGSKSIAASYDFANPFAEGKSVVCIGCEKKMDGEHYTMEGGKWGAINMKGEIVVPVEQENTEAVGAYEAPAEL